MTEKLSIENLIIPQVILDPESGREVVIGYSAKSLLDLRQANYDLSGILTDDSAKWGTIPLRPHKVRRWGQRHGRLIKRLPEIRADGSTRYRYTFTEASEWQNILSDDEQHWLSALLEVDATLYREGRSRRVGQLMTTISEVARLQAEPKKPKPKKKKTKLKAKDRRKRQRERHAEF